MARGIQNFPNITTPDSDYPNGRGKDVPMGTPVNEFTLGDYQQFFAKLMRETYIAPNGLPDNEYNGNQYIEAMKILRRKYGAIKVMDGLTGSPLPIAGSIPKWNPIYRLTASASALASIHCNSPELIEDMTSVTLINENATYGLKFTGFDSGMTINGSPGYPTGITIAANSKSELVYDAANNNWITVR